MALVNESGPNSRWELAIETARIGIWDWDLVSGEVFYSNEWKRLRGLDGVTLTESPTECTALVHPQDLVHRKFELEKLVRGDIERYEFEHRVKHAGGKWIVVLEKVSAIRNAEGVAIRLIGCDLKVPPNVADLQACQCCNRIPELEHVTNNIPGLVFQYVLHPDGNHSILYTSSNVRQMYGVEPAEASKDPDVLWKWIHPEDVERSRKVVGESAQTLQQFNLEHRVVLPDGKTRWYHASCQPERLENGDVIFHGVTLDVTDRKMAQLALEDTKTRLDQTADNIPGIVFRYIAHADGRHTAPSMSSKVKPMFGVDVEEVFHDASGLWNWIDEEDKARKQIALKYSADNLTRFSEQYRVYPPGQPERWYHSIGLPTRLENGDVMWEGVALDITESKKIELALVEAQSKLKRISNNIPGVIYRFTQHTDGKMVVNYISSQCRELFEVEPEEMCESVENFFKRVHPEDVECILSKIHTSAETLQPFKIEYRVQLPENGLCWREDIAQPTRLENGDTVWDGFVIDCTERKKAEIENNALAKAKKIKDEFLATMSHELRTPLNAILATTEGLQLGVFGQISEKQRDSLEIVEQSGLHLLELIDEVLDLAKIEAEQMNLELSKVNLLHLCESSFQLVSRLAEQKNIQLNLNVPWNLPEFQADEKRLRQVLINLLSNAVKFTPEAGRVDVEARLFQPVDQSPDQTLRISVTDTGIGIDEERQADLFQPFVQVESALNRNYPGTGLGLALVKKFVELHGGGIKVKSELGAGSCFTVELPFHAPSVAQKRRLKNSSLPSSDEVGIEHFDSGGLKVLLAEDNEHVSKAVSCFLKAANIQVLRAIDGEEAVGIACDQLPDVILMDIQMPGLDGLEAIKQIRADSNLKDTPIIAMTGLAMPKDRERCLQAGADLFMSKPCRMSELLRNIQGFQPKDNLV